MRTLNTLAAAVLAATTGCAEPSICDKETKFSGVSEVIEIENHNEAFEACEENEATVIFCPQEDGPDIALPCPDINYNEYSAAELNGIIMNSQVCGVFAEDICN